MPDLLISDLILVCCARRPERVNREGLGVGSRTSNGHQYECHRTQDDQTADADAARQRVVGGVVVVVQGEVFHPVDRADERRKAVDQPAENGDGGRHTGGERAASGAGTEGDRERSGRKAEEGELYGERGDVGEGDSPAGQRDADDQPTQVANAMITTTAAIAAALASTISGRRIGWASSSARIRSSSSPAVAADALVIASAPITSGP